MTMEDSWQRLVAWCEQNAPVTFQRLRPPAPSAELKATERRFPRQWPDDLRRWYGLQDGAAWESSNTPLPDWRILSLSEIVESAEMYAGFDDIYDEDELADGEQEEAGSLSVPFLPSFVPIADNITACTLFVDTRPGLQYGCVCAFDRDQGALDGPSWDSVTGMLDDVVTSLQSSSASDGWYPTVTAGELTWELEDPQG
jgi:cell wall assembly regulator SMI1